MMALNAKEATKHKLKLVDLILVTFVEHEKLTRVKVSGGALPVITTSASGAPQQCSKLSGRKKELEATKLQRTISPLILYSKLLKLRPKS